MLFFICKNLRLLISQPWAISSPVSAIASRSRELIVPRQTLVKRDTKRDLSSGPRLMSSPRLICSSELLLRSSRPRFRRCIISYTSVTRIATSSSFVSLVPNPRAFFSFFFASLHYVTETIGFSCVHALRNCMRSRSLMRVAVFSRIVARAHTYKRVNPAYLYTYMHVICTRKELFTSRITVVARFASTCISREEIDTCIYIYTGTAHRYFYSIRVYYAAIYRALGLIHTWI